jgi:hypothetical protein
MREVRTHAHDNRELAGTRWVRRGGHMRAPAESAHLGPGHESIFEAVLSPNFAKAEHHDRDVIVLRGVRAESVEILLQLLQHYAGLSAGISSQYR